MRVYTLSDRRSKKKLRVYTASEAKGLMISRSKTKNRSIFVHVGIRANDTERVQCIGPMGLVTMKNNIENCRLRSRNIFF